MSKQSGSSEGTTLPVVNPLDYYTDPGNYGEPWVTSGASKRNMIGCMHPSCECRKQQRNKIQTPGGGYGSGTDRQIAEIAQSGDTPTIYESLDADYQERNTSVLDIHIGCAYWRHRTGIVAEMATPSAATLKTVDRWRDEIYYKDGITKGLMDEVIGSAGVLLASLPEGEQDDDPSLIAFFGELYSGKNVHRVEPIENPVGIYVVSHVVNVVQNQKDRKHQETPMAYFDSAGALTSLTRNHGDDRTPRTAKLMNGSSILRSAASRTYISNLHQMDLLEVTRRGKDIEFDFVEL